MLKSFVRASGGRIVAALLIASAVFPAVSFGQANQAVYTDSVQNGWENWSWATVNLANASPVHAGTASISVSSTNWQALYFHHTALDSSAYTNINFWINGGTAGGQVVQVQATRSGASQAAVVLSPLPMNSWRQENVSLAALGVGSVPDFDGFWIQVENAGRAPTLYVDDLTLIAGTSPPTTNAPLSISIDASRSQRPINPFIYGVAFASSNEVADLNTPLNRSGGNSETRYNWQLNAHNHAADWYFESLADSPATAGASTDSHIAESKNGGAQAMITVPMIGWTPKLGPGRGRLSSYSIAKYGLQDDNDWQWFPDAGNGVVTNTSALVTTNDPNDANVLTNSIFQRAYVQHLTNKWGLSTNGGVRYYLMDNEHTLWHSTHRDVHPVGTTMQEIRDKFFDYAGMVKSIDPSALVLAPEEWGWPGYFWSGYDQQWSGARGDYNQAHYPDRGTNGGWDYLPWLLDQFRQRATNTNQRLLDYLTVHIYPQGTGEYNGDTSAATQLLRNKSTRSLWDTNYVDQSWINSIVKLIPRLKSWVATYYPGTKIGITEYNWGAESHINGATAQADLLGIFGREELDLATRWTTPAASTPTYKAMKLYRNYDGNKSGFGETSVSATVPNPDNVSAFAASRSSDGALTAMVINKQLNNGVAAAISLTNFVPAGSAQVWQLTSANAITRLPDVTFSGASFTNNVPAQSITLFVLPPAVPPRLRPGVINVGNNFDLWVDGQSGQRYVVMGTTNFVNWVPLQTNVLAGSSWHVILPATNTMRFYRAQWLP